MTAATFGPRMHRYTAVALVFCTSAAVLVLEILAGRLLAPYVGVSLETYTGIIGTVLAAIAVGTAVGGRLADRLDARRLLGPTLLCGGALAWTSLPLLSWLGPTAGEGPAAIVLLTATAFFLPAAVLSAVSPMAAKLRLDDLSHTGEVVGGLSAAGTAGALVGTFLTGFVLVAAWPSRPIVIAIGAGLVVAGLVVWFRHATGAPRPAAAASILAALVLSGGLAVADEGPCRWETAYFCITIETDPTRPTGRVLWMDTLRHSYVDLADPTHLDFRYVRLFAQVTETLVEDPAPSVVHLGGGGFTFPRYLAAVRPDSTHRVLEIDAELVRIARDHLGLVEGEDMEVVVGDARLHLDDSEDASADLVVGDAFGGQSVPWHLTTIEFVAEIRRVLDADGVYVANVIDGGDARFARAEAATLAAEFDHTAVIVSPRASGGRPANHVLVASDAPLDALAAPGAIDPADGEVWLGDEVDAFFEGAPLLTDDFAPVDQLLARG